MEVLDRASAASPPAEIEPFSIQRRGWPYLAGIAGVLLINLTTIFVDNRLISDSLVLISVLLIGFIFSKLFTSFNCTPRVRSLLFCAVLSMIFAQTLSITEEIPAFDEVPILQAGSQLNGFLDTLGMVTGLVLILCALVLAVVGLGVARDRLSAEVAVRIEAESKLARHRDRLEEEVTARTLDLEQAQQELLVQERLAALGELMNTVSHELRNPLGVVRASLYTLEKGIRTGKTDNLAAVVARCERSIVRCDHIIEELNEYGRAQEYTPELTSLDEWLGDLLRKTNLPEPIQCEVRLQSNVSISLDPDRMARALHHLIDNSINALEEDSGRERRLLVTSMKNSTYCRIEIQDTVACPL